MDTATRLTDKPAPTTRRASIHRVNAATAFNRGVADLFLQMADTLRQQQANPFRIKAYVRGAAILQELDADVRQILHRRGRAGLIELPGIGRGLAAHIEEIAHRGRFAQLDRLRGALDSERLLQTVPGIGPRLAKQIHEELDIDTLEALEAAAHDGRLENLSGIGPRRSAMIRSGLSSMLGRALPRYPAAETAPPVALLLDVDREYRDAAGAGRLPKIAPRRFNPAKEAWLPILHTDRNGWHFTALFSNTALAHRLHKTNDWVVVFFYDSDHLEGQHTVVTETRGGSKGRRVVRGREVECGEYYRAKDIART